MDSLSSEVKFEFVLTHGRMINSEEARTRNLKILAEIEGLLTIFTHEGVLFKEDGILLFELGVDLYNWLDEWKRGQVRDFEYITMAHDSEPIISFLQRGNDTFVIDSLWGLLENEVEVETVVLVQAVESFVNALRDVVSRDFGVDLRDYISQGS